MDAKEIKIYLSQEVNRVERLLRHFGFHTFSYQGDNLRCALPDGDNPTSLSLYLNDFLGGMVYTRGNIKGDIFHIIEEVTEKSTSEIFSTTRELFNLPGYRKKNNKKINFATDYVSKYINKYKGTNKTNKLLEGSYLNKFIMLPHKSLIEEGISFDVVKQFSICFDPKRDRIIFPHFDWEDTEKVVGIQGRIADLTTEEAKQLGVPKYWNYINGYRKSLNLYGWNIAKEFVEEEKKLVIFESEKSVLKHFTANRGKGYSVALGGHELSEEQILFIAKNTPIDCEIILAFDKDIMKEEHDFIIECCERISQYRKVSYIFDDIDNGKLLKEKDAPIDNGVKVWNFFFERRVLYNKDEEEFKVG